MLLRDVSRKFLVIRFILPYTPETIAGENFREFRGITSIRESFIREFLYPATRRACGRGECQRCVGSKFFCCESSPRSVENTASVQVAKPSLPKHRRYSCCCSYLRAPSRWTPCVGFLRMRVVFSAIRTRCGFDNNVVLC